MADLSFTNSASGSSALYIASGDANGWCAFVTALDQESPPDVLSFSQVNTTVGYLVFAPKAPSISGTEFVTNLRAYATATGPQLYLQLALVWLTDPNSQPPATTPTFWLNSAGTDQFGILRQFNYNVGNNFLTLFINNSVSVIADATNYCYTFDVPAYLPGNSATLTCNPYGAVANVLQYFRVPLTGEGASRMLFGAAFDAAYLPSFQVGLTYYYPAPPLSEETAPVKLDSPLFAPDTAGYLVLTDASLAPFALLDTSQTYLAFNGLTLQPQSPTTQPTVLRSMLVTDAGLAVPLFPVNDFSTDAAGQRFPGTKASCVVLSEQSAQDSMDSWVLQPSGNYTLSIGEQYANTVDSNGQLRLLCGLAGTESISFTPQLVNNTGDQLRFSFNANSNAAYNLAYAPNFVPGMLPTGQPSGPLLNGRFTTAWVNVVLGAAGNKPVLYHAQPEGASLYAPNQGIGTQYNSFLGYFTASSGTLSPGPATLTFPLVPYGNASWSTGQLAVRQQFEQQVLSPSRKIAIATALAPQAAAAAAQYQTQHQQLKAIGQASAVIHSTSPQGLYMEVDLASGVWNRLQLACNLVDVLVDGVPTQQCYSLEFDALSGPLQSAFQTNQLFMVVSSDRPLPGGGGTVLGNFTRSGVSPPITVTPPGQLHASLNEMSIEGWPFTFNVPAQSPNGVFENVLIFKFRSDLSLLELAQQPSQWATPELFNYTDATNGLGTLPNWLSGYLQSGVDRAQTDPDYAKFASVVTQKGWQGVLGLNVDISLQDFPEGLQGLLAGIDLTRFSAHHFGIDVNTVKAGADNTLQMQQNSALFGLIDYEDRVFETLGYSLTAYQQQAPLNTSADYNFTVLSLKALFENSKILNYSSYLALAINRLFGEKVSAANRQNLLLLAGSYEDHDGTSVYAFNSIPALSGSSNNLLQVQSPVLGAAEVVKASFNTLVSQIQDDSIVTSIFSLWGYLDFLPLKSFDLLSYGNETGVSQPNTGLSFAGMNIVMAFPLATPAAVTYTFDISQLSFDLSQSTARQAGLVRHFPLQLTGITSGTKNNAPKSQGYLSVNLPKLQQQQGVNGAWYGLQFNLNMGTLGALAGSMGFNAVFLMAWNVGGIGASAGLKLPGVNPQAPFFSLQGVLRLNIGSILLTVADDGVFYLMKINNIALKVLALSFPPNGSVNFFLFGNPDAKANPQSLGWYTAYLKNNKTPAALPPAPKILAESSSDDSANR